MSEQETLIYLDPSEIIEPEITNVRPWSSKAGDTEEEINKIKALAATIEEEGQLQPVLVRQVNGGSYELIAGRRRVKAIRLINASRKSGEETHVVALVSGTTEDPLEDAHAFRQAAIENWHREGLSPMDMALDIQQIRVNMKWDGQKNTKKVAEFFKVSSATITQHEKLLKLSPDIQEQIHQGKISRDAAFVLVDVKAEDRPVILEKAAELQKVEASAMEGSIPRARDGATSDTKPLKSRHVRKAVRESESSSRYMPRNRKDILEFFEGMLGPDYGYPDGAIHMFVHKFLSWCAGEISDVTLTRYWDDLIERASKGSPEKPDKGAKAKPKK